MYKILISGQTTSDHRGGDSNYATMHTCSASKFSIV